MPDFGDYTNGGGQSENIGRVSEKIALAVLEFCRSVGHGGKFHMVDLQDFVGRQFSIAPDSPGRILRDLRKRKLLNYRVVSRSESEYQMLPRKQHQTTMFN